MAAKPIILGPNNAAITAAITASTEASGYPKENLQTWREEYTWKGTGSSAQWIKLDAGAGNTITADALGIAGHDLYTNAATDVKLESSANDADWTERVAAFTPGSDLPLAKFFTSAAHRYWKLTFPTYTTLFSVGIIFIGARLTFPRWCASPWNPWHRRIVGEGNVSKTGRMLGRQAAYREREFELNFKRLTFAWAYANLVPLFDDHLPNPFFFVYDRTSKPDDVYWMEAAGDPELDTPWNANSVDFKMKVRGVVE